MKQRREAADCNSCQVPMQCCAKLIKRFSMGGTPSQGITPQQREGGGGGATACNVTPLKSNHILVQLFITVWRSPAGIHPSITYNRGPSRFSHHLCRGIISQVVTSVVLCALQMQKSKRRKARSAPKRTDEVYSPHHHLGRKEEEGGEMSTALFRHGSSLNVL